VPPSTDGSAAADGPAGSDGSAGSGSLGSFPRGLAILLGLAAAVVVGAGMRSLAWMIGPTFLALVLVIALAPLYSRLRARGWPGWLATLVLALGVYLVVLSISVAVIVSIARLATVLPQYAGQSTQLVQSATATLQKLGIGTQQLQAVSGSLDLGKLAQLAGEVLAGIAGLATNLLFILTLLLFLSVEAATADDRIDLLAVNWASGADALRGFASGTRTYLIVSTVFGLIVAVLDTVALWLMGIPLAITWGVLSFVTNYIPNVGFIIGLVPPALLGLLVGGPELMVLVIVVYSVLNFVVQSIIQPRFVGDAVGLSVTVTFLSLLFWAWLLGALGAILAIPLTLLAKALLVDIDPRAQWADAFLREAPRKAATTPAAADATDATNADGTADPAGAERQPEPERAAKS
jgi:predicted PurR-regulated permease PerM